MSVGCQSCKSWGFRAFCILCKKLTGIQYFANDKKWWRNVLEKLNHEVDSNNLTHFLFMFWNWSWRMDFYHLWTFMYSLNWTKNILLIFFLRKNSKSIQNIVCSLLMIQRLHIHECGTDGIHGGDWFLYRPFLPKLRPHSPQQQCNTVGPLRVAGRLTQKF